MGGYHRLILDAYANLIEVRAAFIVRLPDQQIDLPLTRPWRVNVLRCRDDPGGKIFREREALVSQISQKSRADEIRVSFEPLIMKAPLSDLLDDFIEGCGHRVSRKKRNPADWDTNPTATRCAVSDVQGEIRRAGASI